MSTVLTYPVMGRDVFRASRWAAMRLSFRWSDLHDCLERDEPLQENVLLLEPQATALAQLRIRCGVSVVRTDLGNIYIPHASMIDDWKDVVEHVRTSPKVYVFQLEGGSEPLFVAMGLF